MTLDIHIAYEEDMADILKLWSLFEKEDEHVQPGFLALSKNYKNELRKYAEKLKNKNDSVLLIAKVKGRSVGFVNVRLETYPAIFKKTKIGTINDLYVLPNFRKRGIGLELTKKAENWLKGKKARYVILQASSRLVWLGGMYQGIGYSEYEKSYFKKLKP